jgi:hypothetical protein
MKSIRVYSCDLWAGIFFIASLLSLTEKVSIAAGWRTRGVRFPEVLLTTKPFGVD